ncbi:MAG: hypothetical protein LBM39_01565 [Candidatus Methanoplasma sp.]|jgi:hypothetical protein|nr:hypothetical protein [Candidatus Methanoplasma sp.]
MMIVGSDAVTFYKLHTHLSKSNDFRLHGESEPEDVLQGNRYDAVIGDPIFGPLKGRETFILLPHHATSGRIFSKFQVPILGNDIVDYIGARLPGSVS